MNLWVTFLLSTVLALPLYRDRELLVTDFEVTPDYLGSKPEVWGSAYPLSMNLTSYSGDFHPRLIHTGSSSFKLVNSPRAKENWGSMSINLGTILDAKTEPILVRPLDVSDYKYLSFWIRGKNGGEKFIVIFRDAHSKTYLPTIKYLPSDPVATTEWRRIDIPLHQVSDFSEKYERRRLDLTQLVVIGFEFGDNTGNPRGATLYIDDISFRKN